MTRSKPITFLATAAVVPLSALAVAACGGSSGEATGASNPPKTANGQSATVGVENSNLGKILDDSKGETLYLFKKDSGTKSACTGACASAWPPLRASGKPTAGSGANASMLGTTSRSDGKPQVTYDGHPLYTYTGDQHPGDTNGQGVDAFGARWYVLSPSGAQVSSTGSGASGGGGSGY
jgi:predicted lipoprotein with Yx(FWY)xxD motif